MTEQVVVDWIRSKYENLEHEWYESGRRQWAAVAALSLGRGGSAAVGRRYLEFFEKVAA